METSIQQVNKSPLAMASEFIQKDSNVDIDKLAKLLDIQERWEANEAKKAYVEAMARFKADPPKIFKDRHVKYNATEYCHASLENVTRTINEALSTHGLTASWTTSQNEKTVTVTCKITHIFGHSEQTSLTSIHDSSGSKNPIQALGSAISYLQRYTLLSLTGLATEEMDDDGKAAAETKKPKGAPPKEVVLSKDQLDFIDRVKISLEETGAVIDGAKLKEYFIATSKRTGTPVQSDPELIAKVSKWIFDNKKLMATISKKGAA